MKQPPATQVSRHQTTANLLMICAVVGGPLRASQWLSGRCSCRIRTSQRPWQTGSTQRSRRRRQWPPTSLQQQRLAAQQPRQAGTPRRRPQAVMQQRQRQTRTPPKRPRSTARTAWRAATGTAAGAGEE
jgi:hypothetical protein